MSKLTITWAACLLACLRGWPLGIRDHATCATGGLSPDLVCCRAESEDEKLSVRLGGNVNSLVSVCCWCGRGFSFLIDGRW